jgi:selenocysteine lyase/cysteine desulfurase
MLDVDALRARFPALARTDEEGRPFVFADAPGGSQVPDVVIEAVAGRYRQGLANTHGAFATSEETDATIAEARRAAADLTGATPGEVVFGPNATTLLLHLTRSSRRRCAPGTRWCSRGWTTTRTCVRGRSPRPTPGRPSDGSTCARTT